jgi:hypothetical protein
VAVKPWTAERDAYDWQAHGLPCAIRRDAGGKDLRCYVGLLPGHPLHGAERDGAERRKLDRIDVYGGLTHSEAGDGGYLPKGYWWLGFDFNLLYPATGADADFRRDLAYVTRDTEGLAEQLAALSIKEEPA